MCGGGVWRRCVAERRRRRQAEVQNQKQEPHTKMWGKTTQNVRRIVNLKCLSNCIPRVKFKQAVTWLPLNHSESFWMTESQGSPGLRAQHVPVSHLSLKPTVMPSGQGPLLLWRRLSSHHHSSEYHGCRSNFDQFYTPRHRKHRIAAPPLGAELPITIWKLDTPRSGC